jgi:hypothetical protein
MIVYSKEGGYGKQDTKEVKEVIDKYLPVGSRDKVTLLEFLYDYECLMRVIEGRQFIFRHEDGSEVRRIKLL